MATHYFLLAIIMLLGQIVITLLMAEAVSWLMLLITIPMLSILLTKGIGAAKREHGQEL